MSSNYNYVKNVLNNKKRTQLLDSQIKKIIEDINELTAFDEFNKKGTDNNNIITEQILFYKQMSSNCDNNIKNISKTLNIICDHNFTKDYIDISPDSGYLIEYCTYCESEKT